MADPPASAPTALRPLEYDVLGGGGLGPAGGGFVEQNGSVLVRTILSQITRGATGDYF